MPSRNPSRNLSQRNGTTQGRPEPSSGASRAAARSSGGLVARSLLHQIIGGQKPPALITEVYRPDLYKAELVVPESPAANPSGDGDGQFRGADWDPLEENKFFVGDKPNAGHPGAEWLSFDTLRWLSDRSVCAPFKAKRHQHFLEFCKKPKDEYDIGFQLGMRDPDQKITPGAAKELNKLWNALNRDQHFYDTLGLMADDSLTYDWGVAEVRYQRGGRPHSFIARDAKTIRRGRPRQQEGGPYNWVSDSFVQVLPSLDKVVNVWHRDEIISVVRRRRTGLEYFGYGYPEIQQAYEAVRMFLEIDDYNQAYFRNGVHASSILSVIANFSPKKWQAFKQVMTAQVKGVNNVNRLAMLLLSPGTTEGTRERIEKTDLAHNNNDMQFVDMWLIKVMIVAANMNMRPAEAGLPEYRGSGTPLGTSNNSEEIKQSRLYGVRPVLHAFESAINEGFIWRWDEDFAGSFVTDVESEKDRFERTKAKVDTGVLAFNEARIKMGEAPIDAAYFKKNKIPVADEATRDAFITALWLPASPTLLQSAGMFRPEPQGMGPGGPGDMGPGGPDGPPDGGGGPGDVDPSMMEGDAIDEEGMGDEEGMDEAAPRTAGPIAFRGPGPYPGQDDADAFEQE